MHGLSYYNLEILLHARVYLSYKYICIYLYLYIGIDIDIDIYIYRYSVVCHLIVETTAL